MQLSSALCWAQQAIHRDRAAGAQLENVRIIATGAATAWGLEAQSAERREARNRRTREIAEIAAATKQDNECGGGDRRFSENPDRGFASA